MKLFSAVHEIRMLRPSGVAVGYFNDCDLALRAIEAEPTQYKAAYFTLNPLKLPAEIPLNPQALTASCYSAGDSDIARRVWLLVDVDPPRPPSTNSTDAEKQAAREQADRVREFLRSRGWPEPTLCDSANGWHLLFRVNLPNNSDATELIRGVLARLHQLFPMVDPGNFNASRLCKLYGTWARKGEHSEERPWRKSAIINPGSDENVAEAQLRELCPVVPRPIPKGSNAKLEQLLGFLDYYGVVTRSDAREVPGGWQIEIECPWADEHSGEAHRDSVVSFIAGFGLGFRCLHAHCTERHWREFRAEMERRNPGLPPFFEKRPAMTHSDIARQFVEDHDDFTRIYDEDNATGVWIPGARWQIGDAGDARLRMAIRSYLDELYSRYPQPEPGKRDARLVLKQAPFVSGVLSEVKPWLPPKSHRDFDIDPEILPLPNGLVADLRRGQLREMRREDCQTKRIRTMPGNTPTPRWDRFLREITCGDDELAEFIVRLLTLSITGLSLHYLIFLYGVGRNGKGCLLRLLEKILGTEIFATVIKPDEIEYQRGSSDKKRLMGRLRGMRMCYTGETVGGNLDWTLCKTLTGGDTLSGAKLYQDEAAFTPTHTLFLTTNDRPKLPPTAAFKGRLVFVPFHGDFSKSRDMTLEDDLAREAPGILWKLIQKAPAILKRGVEPPASVVEATDDLLDENDVARPFIEARLAEDPDALTTLADMEAAIRKWIGGVVVGADESVTRIMKGVRAHWQYGRKRVQGKKEPVRGLIGVRIVESS